MSAKEESVSVALSKGLMIALGSIMVSGVIGFCGALFIMYEDVAVLKSDQEKWNQTRQVSVKQWEKLRRLKDKEAKDIKEIHEEIDQLKEAVDGEIDEVKLYLYTFHGLDIMNIPHTHREGR